jgi:hypothetical protein
MTAKKDRAPRQDDPDFFILPPPIKALYERRLRTAKRTWLVTGDTGALREAAYHIKHHGQPMPDWFFDAVVTILTSMRSVNDVKRAQFAVIHSQRYQVVRDQIADAAVAGIELSIDKVCARVADAFNEELGSFDDVKKSYFKVKAALKQGRGAAFNTVHLPKGLPR